MEVLSTRDAGEIEAVDGAHLAQLAAGERTSVQHFRLEPGTTVPEHSHPHEQAGFVAAGAATFRVDGEAVRVEAGDAYVIPGEESHAVTVEGDVAFEGVDVFSPPRTDPDWAESGEKSG